MSSANSRGLVDDRYVFPPSSEAKFSSLIFLLYSSASDLKSLSRYAASPSSPPSLYFNWTSLKPNLLLLPSIANLINLIFLNLTFGTFNAPSAITVPVMCFGTPRPNSRVFFDAVIWPYFFIVFFDLPQKTSAYIST